jgi:hypothetical protein
MSTVPNGVFAYGNTLVASTVTTVTFADRLDYFAVTNLGTTVLYASGDGSTPSTAGGSDCGEAVGPGLTVVIANGLPNWFQSSNVIPAGSIQVGNGAAYNASTNPSTPRNPGTVTQQRSLAGGGANPGTTVKLISTSTPAFVIAAAG